MSNASAWQVFAWVALPYLALGIFVVGHVWRWRYDQFGSCLRRTRRPRPAGRYREGGPGRLDGPAGGAVGP